jgi:branched-chain amino acid transport system permease protein
MVILGGLGNITGVILGAVLLSILPEFLREYGAYRMMSYGLILIVLMALRPQGIMGGVGFLLKRKIRPDKDQTGRLKASTELYYDEHAKTGETAERKAQYTRSSRAILELNNITMDFGGIKAVDDLSLVLHEKEILSIIGPNGAGKTTLFNLISGIYPPSAGGIYFEGRNITEIKTTPGRQSRDIKNISKSATVQQNERIGQCPGRPILSNRRRTPVNSAASALA